MIFALVYVILFGLLNRARGSHLYGLTGSTSVSRVIPMFLMALMATFAHGTAPEYFISLLIYFILLYAWSVPAWDAYWGAELGLGSTHSRLWGLGKMSVRMALIVPFYLFLSWQHHWEDWYFSASFLLMSLSYYLLSFVVAKPIPPATTKAVEYAELINGAVIGATILLIGAQ